ncbi:hypothetical protein ACTQXV_09610 [Ligilactobacillus salivarius]|uniref:hypothetical protein n=1 Tax=Ligilactobacillus salivarius TaxID=1624 RepID=UPI003F9A88E2
MAINFDPIFSGMQNGPEKIKGNFDKVNDGLGWGEPQNFLNMNGITSEFSQYKVRKDGNAVIVSLYVTGAAIDSSSSVACYLPTSISKRIGYSLSTQVIGRTDNNALGFMNIATQTGKCTFHKPDASGLYIQATIPLV